MQKDRPEMTGRKSKSKDDLNPTRDMPRGHAYCISQ
jgi:hypothetical protein